MEDAVWRIGGCSMEDGVLSFHVSTHRSNGGTVFGGAHGLGFARNLRREESPAVRSPNSPHLLASHGNTLTHGRSEMAPGLSRIVGRCEVHTYGMHMDVCWVGMMGQ
jgi:hypothetical protein